MLPLYIFHGLVIVLLIGLAVVFFCGKGSFLIAGYNTASEAEKSRYDEKLLCRFMGKLMFILAACWLIVALGSVFKITFLLVAGISLFIAIIIGAAMYANTGGRFKK